MIIEPLKKEIYNKAKELGVETIELKFQGGNDEGYLDVYTSPHNSDFESEIEEWAWEVYDYNGAGDGNDYGDNIIYNIKEGKAHSSEWFMQVSQGEEDSCDLEVAEEQEEE